MDKREIFGEIAKQVATSELVFPTGAQVALKLRQSVEDPDCDMRTAGRLIQAEPLLSAQVIKIANSVAFNRSGREITDIQMATSLLGFATLRSMAMALVTRQMAGPSTTREHQKTVDKLWEHSAHVASLAMAIARHVTHVDPEKAMFLGIIHEIGGFYMLSRAKEFPGLLDDDFSEWLEGGEVAVSRQVIERLNLPASIMTVMEDFWDGFLALPPVTLADTLQLAEQLAPVASPLHQLKSPAVTYALKADIEMLIGEEKLSLILQEAAEEIASLASALKFN